MLVRLVDKIGVILSKRREGEGGAVRSRRIPWNARRPDVTGALTGCFDSVPPPHSPVTELRSA